MSERISTPAEFYKIIDSWRQQCDDIYSRYGFMKSEFERIFESVTGRSTLLADYITDKHGNVSERKIQMLINRLMECCGEKYVTRTTSMEKRHRDRMEFYRCFLYCAINGFTASMPLEFRRTQTFGDIIRMSSDTSGEKTDILECELGFLHLAYPDCTGFFGSMCYAYKLITGKNTADEFTDEQRAAIHDAVKEHEKYIRMCSEWDCSYRTRADGTFMTDDEFEKAMDEEDKKYGEMPYTPEEQKTIEEEEKLRQEAWAARDEWLISLKDRDKFIKCYKRARELCFKYGDSLGISENITRMIDCFLCINGLSDLADEETALDTVYCIRRVGESIVNSQKKRRVR